VKLTKIIEHFFSPRVRLGSWRPWWSANQDKIYQVVRESEKIALENLDVAI